MQVKQNIGSHLRHHSYPGILLWRPQLIRWLYAWNLLVLQRNQVSRRVLARLLRKLSPGGLVVDAGCGEGQYIFPFFKKYSQLKFFGFDKNENHVAFCRRFASVTGGAVAPQFFRQNLEDMALENEADLLLCIGTLQYIGDDRRALENFCNALKINGKLLVYVPVNGRSVLPFYPYFFEKTDHYEKSQQRRRVYAPEEVFEKIRTAGFAIRERHFTYGTLGIVGHEIYSLLLMGMGNLGRWAWLLAPLFLVLMPLVLLLKRADQFFPKKTGNGLLVVAEKQAA